MWMWIPDQNWFLHFLYTTHGLAVKNLHTLWFVYGPQSPNGPKSALKDRALFYV